MVHMPHQCLMDQFEDLLEVLDGQTVEADVATSPSVKAALANAPPVSLPPNSSISLLLECFKNVWAETGTDSTSSNTSTLSSPQPSFTSDANAPSVAADPTNPGPTRSERNSRLSRAVKKRIQRDKAGSSSSSEDSTAAPTTDKDDTMTTGLRDTAPSTDGNVAESNAVVATCFQSFLAEMKDFQRSSSQLQTRQDIAKYADYLHQKYIILGLDKVNGDECATAAKTRKIIENFITKLRSRADGQAKLATVAPWACAVCTFQNSPSNCKCQTCGRVRGTTPKKKAPPKPVHVPIISASARAKKSNKSPLDRRKDMFLKQKDDYEQDALEDIADEITELLSVVQAAAHKPK